MDDTAQSRTSDVGAAATRKRRSSILKSQRPPRTPFCELEFKVCTPTDTSKSRRVSFSRLTGVAEFAKNEATTTWKNFYEEHNKSMESSGTDSDANKQKQSIGHLGRRNFEQMFDQDWDPLNPELNISTSINNINFTQVECTDSKLTAPQKNFELSVFTEQQSKFFYDDLAVPCTGEVTDQIDVNFSTVQPIDGNDLDENQRDLEQQSNAFCQGSFSDYIEIDLNMTHAGIKDSESDMSITNPIDSPKVQDLLKSFSIDKKVSVEKDWVMDKENIAINPYIAPRESVNFAINEEPDKVLVFDGKKLIVQTEKENFCQILLPNTFEVAPQRKTIVSNCNDDTPNFIDDAQVSNNASGFVGVSKVRQSVIIDSDMSITEPQLGVTQSIHRIEKQQRTILNDDDLCNLSVNRVVSNVMAPETEKRRTILYDNDTGNISVTRIISSNIIDKEKRKTVLYENNNSNISVTQAVPAKVIFSNDNHEKNKTILYENEACDISMTQVIPHKIIATDNTATKRRTILFENDNGNVSITQPIPNVLIKDTTETPRTVAYEDKTGNISVSQSFSSNENLTQKAPLPERRRTVIFESDMGDISVTQALPSNIIIPQKLNATSYEDDTNISRTRAVTTNILLAENVATNSRQTVLHEVETNHLSINQPVTSSRVIQGLVHEPLTYVEPCETEIVHENNEANTNESRAVIKRDDIDISMTEAIQFNQILPGYINKQQENPSSEDVTVNKRMTIVFDNDAADISVTQAVHMNKVIEAVNEQKQKEIDLIESSYAALHKQDSIGLKKTIVFKIDDTDVSLSPVVKLNQVLQGLVNDQKQNISHNDLEVATNAALHFQNDPVGSTTVRHDVDEKTTIVYEDVDAMIQNEDLFLTEAIPEKEKQERTIVGRDTMIKNESVFSAEVVPVKEQQKIKVAYEDAVLKNKDLFMEIDKIADVSQDKNEIELEASMPEVTDADKPKRKTSVDEREMSITQEIHQQDVPKERKNKRRSVVFDGTTNKTLSKPIPAGMFNFQSEIFDKSFDKDMSARDTMLQNLTNVTSDVLVYHAETVSASLQKAKTENDDSKNEDSVAIPNGDETETPAKAFYGMEQISYSSMKTKIQIPAEKQTKVETYDHNQKYNEELQPKLAASCVRVALDTAVEIPALKAKNSILNDLLDMSHSSMEGLEDKIVMTENISEPPPMVSADKPEIECSTDATEIACSTDAPEIECSTDVLQTQPLAFITKDSEKDVQTEETEKNMQSEPSKREKSKMHKISKKSEKPIIQPIEFKDKKEPVLDIPVKQKKLSELEGVLKNYQSRSNNDSFSKGSKECLDMSKKEILPRSGISFRMANNTKDLLEMISDITDIRKSCNLDPLEEDKEIQESVVKKGQLALEYKKKKDELELKKNSFVSKRQSIALSHEELKNNISMAGSALRKSRLELDETDIEDTTMKESPDPDVPLKKTIRMSTEVVKTLNFEDEDSYTNISIQTDAFRTPLKKTAFEEISHIKETKARVIPDYLRNVSDGIKELMDDLVKPMADVLPFNTTMSNKGVKHSISTCSNQIQTNLLTSSQIDLDTELYSRPESEDDLPSLTLAGIITDAVDGSISQASESPVKFSPVLTQSEKSLQIVSHDTHAAMAEVSHDTASEPVVYQNTHPTNYTERRDPSGRVLIFDHNNPLNNVLLMPPMDTMEVHKYNPVQSTGTLHVSGQRTNTQISGKDTMEVHKYNPIQSTESIKVTGLSTMAQFSDKQTQKDSDVDGVTTHYLIQSKLNRLADNSKADVCSFTSDDSKTFSTDQSSDEIDNEYKNIEVNTVIAMKGNKELLEASSSLTLVEEPIVQGNFDADSDSHTTPPREDGGRSSPAEVLYKVEDLQPEKLDSDWTSNEVLSPENKSKPKKRGYSPTRWDKHKHCTVSTLDVSPKPVSKLAKHSYGPIHEKPIKLPAEKDESEHSIERTTMHRKPKKTKYKKPGTTVTVQQMMPMVHVESVTLDAESTTPSVKSLESVETVLRGPISSSSSSIESRTQTVSQMEVQQQTIAMSFTSSKNLKDYSHETSPNCSPAGSKKCLKAELVQNSSTSGIISKSPTSGVNVIDLIDLMPSIGSEDCEWESSTGDTWSFRLLHSRLRLCVTFSRCPRVRPDTRVLNVALDLLQQDKKNPLGMLCVKFASEMMRFYISRGCERGSDVPKLVRRVVGVARLAAQWGRAMHDARARLAYTLTDDGWLSLKVANTSLRYVWEVTLHMEMVVEEPAPWPRAGRVRVASVLGGGADVATAVRQVVADTPRDWGHVPRTVWRVFKYLKHKKLDDEILQL